MNDELDAIAVASAAARLSGQQIAEAARAEQARVDEERPAPSRRGSIRTLPSRRPSWLSNRSRKRLLRSSQQEQAAGEDQPAVPGATIEAASAYASTNACVAVAGVVTEAMTEAMAVAVAGAWAEAVGSFCGGAGKCVVVCCAHCNKPLGL